MKFYDLDWLAQKCGTENKYEITAKIAAEARRESEETSLEKGNSGNERYISNVLHEIEEGISPVNASPFEADSEQVTELDAAAPDTTEEPAAAEPNTEPNAELEK